MHMVAKKALEVTSNGEEINPITLVIVELCLSELH